MKESTLDPNDAVFREVIPAGDWWVHEIKKGQTLRILDLEGNAAVHTGGRARPWAGEVLGLNYELSAARRTNPQISPTFDWNPAPLVAEDWSKPEVTERNANGERRVNVVFRTRAVARVPNPLKLEAATPLISVQTGTAHGGFINADGSVRTPIWLAGEHISRDQYDVVQDKTKALRYGTRTLARAKPGTTFWHRMAAWPAAFEDAKIEGFKRAQHRFIGAGGSGKHGDPNVIPAGNFTLSVMYVPVGQGNAESDLLDTYQPEREPNLRATSARIGVLRLRKSVTSGYDATANTKQTATASTYAIT